MADSLLESITKRNKAMSDLLNPTKQKAKAKVPVTPKSAFVKEPVPEGNSTQYVPAHIRARRAAAAKK